jgi:NADPH2:quinone reductase
MRGARVLGTTSTPEKAALAREAGAAQTIDYTREDFAAEARRATGGRGVDVVYDSVGRTTWEKSLDSLARRGMLVLFGQSSGAVPPLDPLILAQKGSLYLTRPTLGHYTATREDLTARAGEVLEWVREGKLHVRIDREFPLRDAADAHRALEGRSTTGKVLLVP